MATQKNTKVKAKTPQFNIAKKKQSKIVTSDSVKKKYKFYNKKELSVAHLEDLADALMAWADNGKPKTFFEEFLKEWGIARMTMSRHLERSEKVCDAKDYALQMISYYRERKAYKVNYWATFRHTQGLYSPEWKSQEEYFNKLRIAVKAQADATKIVVMDRYGNIEPPSKNEEDNGS